jgi:hypothetical protein
VGFHGVQYEYGCLGGILRRVVWYKFTDVSEVLSPTSGPGDKQHATTLFLVLGQMKGAQTHGQLAARLWSEMFCTIRCIRVYRNA